MDDRATLFRLFAVLLALSMLLLWLSVHVGGLPLIGVLPGDFDLDVRGGSLYLPITTSVLLGILLTLVAYGIQKLSRK